MSKHKFLAIGIDADIEKTGISITNEEGLLLSCVSKENVIGYLLDNYKQEIQAPEVQVFCILEDIESSLHLNEIYNTFNRYIRKVALKKAFIHNYKKALDKGKLIQVTRQIKEDLRNLGIKTYIVPSSQRQNLKDINISKEELLFQVQILRQENKNYFPSKMKASLFKEITGFKGRLNSEQIDSALLLTKYLKCFQ